MMSLGLTLTASTSLDMVAYFDADWVGCPDTRRSTSGYCVYFSPSLVSLSSKRQPTVWHSSAEAEYRTVANAVAECTCLRQLLQELHQDVSQLRLSTVTTSLQCTFPPPLFIIVGPSTLSWTFTLCMNRSSLDAFRFSMFRPHKSLLM